MELSNTEMLPVGRGIMTHEAIGGQGVVCGIAYRPTDGDAMLEVDSCEILLRRGLANENRPTGKREVTLLSKEAWQRTCAELGSDLPWHTRRANLLIEGVDLTRSIGKTLAVGTARIHVHGESKPCALMDQQHRGLRTALASEGRGGVFGRVVAAGAIRVGDSLAVCD